MKDMDIVFPQMPFGQVVHKDGYSFFQPSVYIQAVVSRKKSPSNYSIIRVTLNTKLDTLWFVKVGGPMEGLRKKYGTFPES